MAENEPSALKASDDETKNKSTSSALDSSRDMDNLEERFSQQQEIISQLKEMVIAEETARTEKIANTRLKMEKYVSQLAKIRDRAKHKRKTTSETSKGSESFAVENKSIDTPDISLTEDKPSEIDVSSTSLNISATSEKPKVPNREVTKLLHQQIKERKAMIAERTKNDKELEKALMKIQKQLEENQNQSAEVIQITQPKVTSSTIPFVNEGIESRIVIELKSRITQLEGNVLDLQETCKEKDNVIKSKTEAITLMSADLSKKGKNTLDLLDETKEQMQKMQENFANMENDMKIEKQSLFDELEVCKNKITYLEEANSILENERFKLSLENSNLEEKIHAKDIEINNINCLLQEKVTELEGFAAQLNKIQEIDKNEEKGIIEAGEMAALSEKIEIIEKLNSTLRQSNIELQEKIKTQTTEQPKSSPSRSKSKFNKGSAKDKNVKNKPQTDEKNNHAENIKKLEMIIDSLNKQILEKEIFSNQKDIEIQKLKDLVETVKKSEIEEKIAIVEDIVEKTTETINTECPDSLTVVEDENKIGEIKNETTDVTGSVQDANIDSLKEQLEDALKQIEKLSKEISESNKNMIKLKASHKNKIKQMQKTIDDFSKVSHSNSEVVRLQSEVNSLTQKITELEDDKGNLQLHLMDYDSGKVSDSQLHAKMVDLENVAEERLKAIADLEMQKFDLVQELHIVRQKVNALEDKISDLTFLENEHVSSEIKHAQLEEQLDILKMENINISTQIDKLRLENNSLSSNVESLCKEKNEINNKLEYYIQENIELVDRLEKLSAEKVSSAESIEMVELLTSQEKLEIEQYQKRYTDKDTQDKCAEESKDEDNSNKADASSKIDLYSQERCEALEKLEILQTTNNEITLKLEKLNNEKSQLAEQCESVLKEKDNILSEQKINEEKIVELNSKIEELVNENKSLTEKINNASIPSRIEEVIVSETVEVVDTIEKELIEHPSKSETSQELESKPKEIKESASESSKTSLKGDKKFTKEILRLKNTLKHKESEISELSAKLLEFDEIVKSNDILKNDYSLLNMKLQEIMDENVSLNNCIVELKDGNNTSQKDLANFNQEIDKMKNNLSEDLLIKENEIKVLEDLVEKKNSEILELKQVCENKDDILNSQNEKVILELDKKVAVLQNIITQNENEISRIHSELYDSIDNSDKYAYYISSLNIQIENITEIINNKQEKIVNLTEEKSTNLTRIVELETECAQKDELINTQMGQLAEIRENQQNNLANSISHYESDIHSLREKCSGLEANEIREKEKYDLLQESCRSKELKLTELENTLREESETCIKLQKTVVDLSNTLQDESLKYCAIENNFSQLQSENLSLQSKCDSIQNEFVQSNVLNDELKNQIKQLQIQINELYIQMDNSSQIIESCKQENAIISSQNEALTTKISEYVNQIMDINVQNESYSNTIGELKNEIKNNESALSKISELEEQLDCKQEEIKTLLNKLEDLQNTYNESSSAHDAKIQEREVYIESLEIELNKYKEKVVRLEENLLAMESLEKKANSLVMKLEEKDLAFSESQQHEDDLNKKLISLTAQDKLIQKQLSEIKRENNELIEKIDTLNESKKQIQIELDNSKSELLDIRDKLFNLDSVNQDRDAALERCNLLESQLRDLSFEYSEKLNTKTNECEYLDSALQSQNENFDLQLKQLKEHCKNLQDDNSIKTNTIQYIETENERLKTEIEILNSEKTNIKKVEETTSALPLFKFEDPDSKQKENLLNSENANLQMEIAHLTNLLKEKDENIIKLQKDIDFIKSASQSFVNESVSNKSVQKLFAEPSQQSHKPNTDVQESIIQSIEDQIITSDDKIKESISSVETPMIRSFCHDPPVAVSSVNLTYAMEEEIISPKKAFECFQSEASASFIQSEQLLSNESQNKEILALKNTIDNLNLEKGKIASDLALNQQKTNKALLKLKEYKLKYDALNGELKKLRSSSVASDLDTTIQDELASQITKLEEKLKEMIATSEKEKIEKGGLLKRVDVLTSANERLLEMKEKQDLEMGVIRAKNLSLNEKVKNLQWGDDFNVEEEENVSKSKDSNCENHEKTINELNMKLNELENDNENLQFALDEQKNKFELLIQNEKKVVNESSDSLIEYKSENENLKKMLQEMEESLKDKDNIKATYDAVFKECSEVKVMLEETSNNLIQNNIELESLKIENADLKNKLTALVEEYSSFQDKYKTIAEQKDKLEIDISEFSTNFSDLENENKKLYIDCTTYRNELSKIQYEKDEISDKYESLSKKLMDITQNKGSLELELQQSLAKISEMQSISNDLQSKIDVAYQNLNTYENIKTELERKVFELERRLSDSVNNDSANTIHDICTTQINDITAALNEAKKKLFDVTNENEEYKKKLQYQFSEDLEKYKTLLMEKDAEILNFKKQLHDLNEFLTQQQQNQIELQKIIQLKDNDLQNFSNFNEICSTKFAEYEAICNAKDSELLEKSQEVQMLHHKLGENDLLIQQLADFEAKLGDITHEKDAELADLRLKMHAEKTSLESTAAELSGQIQYLDQQLQAKIEECKNLNAKMVDLQTLVDEEAVQMSEMRSALENQEIEIVTLKENLTVHSEAYEKLNKAYIKSGKHVTFSEDTNFNDDSVNTINKSDQSSSPRADLDFALYALHQRDVRCEELTVELMQLLEERDTLQLKLSNAIRTNEELRSKIPENQTDSQVDNSPESTDSKTIPTETMSHDLDKSEASSSQNTAVLIPEVIPGSSLENKISELHTVSHLRDIRVKDERESRQRQMELLHRDIQNLPPEAVAQLREAHYTLSRDTQSPSTVLFNWLWGKTTPKVVHM